VTYALMWIGNLALAGIPPFAGFYSKDIVLEAAYAANTGVGTYAFYMGLLAAFLTAFYSWRLLFMTFHGAPRADEKTMAHVHESPMVMIGPLLVLATGAVLAGWVMYDNFVGGSVVQFWGNAILVLENHPALENARYVPTWVKLSPLVVGGVGIVLAYIMYIAKPDLPARMAETFRPIYLMSFNKWYVDELYDKIFVRPAFYLGRQLWKVGDGTLIDGVGPDGIARAVRMLARRVSALQSGYVYHYAFGMMIGVVTLITWYLFTSAG
ncbi:MAG: NADH-quinone oxidoreductase subunit L, partial [Rhodospirillales bacterium]|nr:NADH-quinone oxidoreductase subunit L [Rhodospirillales bacterium]